MSVTLRAVREFMTAFGQTMPDHPYAPELTEEERALLCSTWLRMRAISKDLHEMAGRLKTPGKMAFLRLQLIQEELSELAEGFVNRDVVEILDAECDLQYVVDGTFLATGHGRVKLSAFMEVHRSNMTKLDDDGRPVVNEAGRVVKGPNYQPPRLEQFCE